MSGDQFDFSTVTNIMGQDSAPKNRSWTDTFFVTLDFFPHTFFVTFVQLILMSASNGLLFLLMYHIIWPNEYYNEIFTNGIGIFHGWGCGKNHHYNMEFESGHIIFICSQMAGLCLYTLSAIFCFLDYYLEKNNTLYRYKVTYPPPRPTQTKISWKLYKKSIILARINALFALFFVPIIFIPIMESRGNCNNLWFDHENDRKHYSLSYDIGLLIFKVMMAPIVSDIIFYITHRSCHEIPFLYRNIHKIHHEFVNTYGISATASHPIEHLFCNLTTVMGTPIIVGLPLYWFYIFVCLASLQTTCAHSGFGNPFRRIQFGSATPHDFHHHYQNCEYGNGANGLLDKIFKTQLKDKYPKRYQQMKQEYDKLVNSENSRKKKH
eukprot:508424_1